MHRREGKRPFTLPFFVGGAAVLVGVPEVNGRLPLLQQLVAGFSALSTSS